MPNCEATQTLLETASSLKRVFFRLPSEEGSCDIGAWFQRIGLHSKVNYLGISINCDSASIQDLIDAIDPKNLPSKAVKIEIRLAGIREDFESYWDSLLRKLEQTAQQYKLQFRGHPLLLKLSKKVMSG